MSHPLLARLNASHDLPLNQAVIYQDPENKRIMLNFAPANHKDAWRISYVSKGTGSGALRIHKSSLDPAIHAALIEVDRNELPFDVTTGPNNMNNRLFLELRKNDVETS